MIRITNPDAIDDIQRALVRLGAIPLPVRESVLIVITPEQFAKVIEAERENDAMCDHQTRLQEDE